MPELRALQLHLHPIRREALTASDKALTRWSLDTNPATVLAQISTAPESVFFRMYSPHTHLHTYGGVTGSPDGLLFAMQQLKPDRYRSPDPCMIEWRNWDDLSVARAGTLPTTCGECGSLASSPNGRWLVIESVGQLFLLDWQTGEILSHHDTEVSYTNGLTFDATSTFVAGVFYDEGCFLKLWRLDSAERFVPRPSSRYHWPTHEPVPQDVVVGSMALTLVVEDLERAGVEWPNRYLADAPGWVAFSPDSRIVLFCRNVHSTPYSSMSCLELTAFEVSSGKLLWSAHNVVESTGQPNFSPDSSVLLLPELGGDLLVYRAEDGALVQRLPTGLNEPIQALAFDHDGKTLWLATEDRLVQH